MTALSDLPYPLRLCTELLHYSAWGCAQTADLKASEIRIAVGQFFDQATIAEAEAILCGRSNVQYGCEHSWQDIRNQVIESGEACLKCGVIRAGNIQVEKEP